MTAISASPEFKRISALPRRKERDWSLIAAELTEVLKTKDGEQALWPIQAQALIEMGECQGMFGSIVVGGGKTLISLLAPYVLNLDRGILLLPAALVQKTINEGRVLAKHWNIRMPRIVAYEKLSLVKWETLLQSHRPDGLLCDEAHRLKSLDAGVTKRVRRYMKENPGTPFILMSGTVMKKSLHDFGHLIRWTHKESAPVPREYGEFSEWANALDEGVNPLRATDPGVLVQWCSDTSLSDVVRARKGFQDRLTSTPGVVATTAENVVNCSLYINMLEYETNAKTEDNFEILRTCAETPDNWEYSTGAEAWMYARQLALGLHYVWDPRPEPEWRSARSAWGSYVRDKLSASDTYDTEKHLADALRSGRLVDPEGTILLREWKAQEPTFTINPDFHWHDDSALEVCMKWAKKGPGIIWIEHQFFGQELAKRTGLSYFRAKGVDTKGRHLSDLSEAIKAGSEKPGVILASTGACSTGFNLQPWRRNLITAPQSDAALWEQLLARTHRPGQLADNVEADVMVGCLEHWDSWHKATAQAQATQDLLGQPQKLVLADKNFDLDIRSKHGFKWEKKVKKKI